jgi:hypothetical protein
MFVVHSAVPKVVLVATAAALAELELASAAALVSKVAATVVVLPPMEVVRLTEGLPVADSVVEATATHPALAAQVVLRGGKYSTLPTPTDLTCHNPLLTTYGCFTQSFKALFFTFSTFFALF